ncbi:MAG: hypothetical protein EOR69_31955 [Mesorhizobium sp.]|nr:MAG: hypothetical protein EOR69_31955 [Mesorhizobium sp.]RWL92268.1 MAG: hypothetical protein EOR70_32120 [Mesorhizobium sp.]
MSVLARPQGLPERVWSLVAGLEAIGGSTDRETFEALINPGFTKDDDFVQTKPELARDTLGAASSLGLLEFDRNEATLKSCFASADDLADHIHDHLANLAPGDTNSVMFETYAWLVAESDRQGSLSWIYEIDRKAFADQANAVLVGQDEDGRLMNDTKVLPWRRWLAFMGLGVPLPLGSGVPDYPSAASRIAREVRRAGFSDGEEIPADRFLATLAERMPYLDGGRLFAEACARIGHVPRQRSLSPLVSAALWDLHDDGTMTLRPRGDSKDAFRLSGDPSHSVQTFNLVIVGVTEEKQ